MERTNVVSLALIAALAVWSNTPARAAEITIMVNQGALSGVRDLAAGFEKASGHKVVIDFVGVPEQAEKINSDAPGDVVVNFMPAFDDLIKRNKVVGSVVEFARAGIAVADRLGVEHRLLEARGRADVGLRRAGLHGDAISGAGELDDAADHLVALDEVLERGHEIDDHVPRRVGVDLFGLLWDADEINDDLVAARLLEAGRQIAHAR